MIVNAADSLVFDIVRGSFVDGPGIRSVVFMKGCPLRCVWCQNPESQELYPEDYKSGDKGGIGEYISPDHLTELLLRDIIFHQVSGGGVTFSGGEPLMHIDYLAQVSSELKKHGIHVAIETCGHFDYTEFESALRTYVDMIFFDIKVIESSLHSKYTGCSNYRILDNFRKLLHTGIKIVPRIPLVPNCTATEENLSHIARLFNELGIRDYALLPYNPSGIDKRSRLGKKTLPLVSEKPMSLAEEKKWEAFFETALEKTISCCWAPHT